MKEFKTILLVGIMLFSGHISNVHADTFDYSGEVFSKLKTMVESSAQIFSKPEGAKRDREIIKICNERTEYLRRVLDKSEGDVHGFLGSYATACALRSSGYEISQLRRSRTWAELQHNAGSMIKAYEHLRNLIDLPEEKGEADRDDERVPKKQFMRTRENRRGWRGGSKGHK